MSNTFQDRLAQYILALLYTSNHIDITIALPNVKIVQHLQRHLARIGRNNLSANQKATANQQGRVQHDTLFANAKLLAMNDPFMVHNIDVNPVIGPVIRHRVNNQEPTTSVSEIDQDTVAVVICHESVYVACNYKIRRSVPQQMELTYQLGSFDTMSDHSLTLIKDAVADEIIRPAPVGAPALPGEDLADHIQYICIIGLRTAPEDQFASAAPHAEMQLLNYLDSMGLSSSVNGLYWGVSKECCSRCADVLHRRQARFGARHDHNVTNWLDPAQINTELKSILLIDRKAAVQRREVRAQETHRLQGRP